MTQDEIIRMAREAGFSFETGQDLRDNIPALERFAALVAAHEREKQSEQEPVAWRDSNGWFTSDKQLVNTKYDKWTAVYVAPVRTKDLTDDEIRAIWLKVIDPDGGDEVMALARAVIAADREKNRG